MMPRFSALAAAVAICGALGVASGELAWRWPEFRTTVARILGWRPVGHADTLTLYEPDLQTALAEDLFCGRRSTRDDVLAQRLALLKVQERARKIVVSDEDISRVVGALRAQAPTTQAWHEAVQRAGLDDEDLRDQIALHLRALRWSEAQVERQLHFDEAALQPLFTAGLAKFAQPLRYRARHLFLAASPEKPAELRNEQRKAMTALKVRFNEGENLDVLIEEASEDEYTKHKGGDLGYFSAYRMPGEFVAALAGRAPGAVVGPIQTALGFHLIALTEVMPARGMSFEEVKPELLGEIQDRKRREVIQELRIQLGAAGPPRQISD